MKYLLFLFIVTFVGLADEIRAEAVQARYLQNSGYTTVLELTIANPSPSSIIVKQQIPPGTQIKSASPQYVKFHSGKGQVKWLFKRPVAGTKTITLQYKQPLAGNGATAVISCKNPTDGQLMTITLP